MDKLNKARNSMAHYVIEYSPESIQRFLTTQEITFLKFEKAIEKISCSISCRNMFITPLHK